MSAATLELHFDPTGDLLQATRACEADTFGHWYGNTRQELSLEYGPYEPASVFVTVSAGDDVVAACRLVTPGPQGLKSLVDVGRSPWAVDGGRAAAAAGIDPSTTWDIATLGVRPGLPGPSTMRVATLYHGIFQALQANRVSAVVAILDDRVRRLMGSIGVVLHTLPGTRTAPYLGSAASTPVYGRCASVLGTQRRLSPDAHRLVTTGSGLDGVRVPAPSAFRLTPRPSVVDVTEQALSQAPNVLDLTGHHGLVQR